MQLYGQKRDNYHESHVDDDADCMKRFVGLRTKTGLKTEAV